MYWILIILCIVIIIYNASQFRDVNEGFTPTVNRLYRPHIRKARLYMDGFINHYSNDYIKRNLKKYGLY